MLYRQTITSGFTPGYHTTISPEGLSPEQFLVLALEAANQAGWVPDYISAGGFIAFSLDDATHRDRLRLEIGEGTILLESSSTGSEMTDSGRNKQNIEAFLELLESLRLQHTPEALQTRYQDLEPSLDREPMQASQQTAGQQLKSLLSIFKPVPGYTITPVLLHLNILVFVLMALNGANILSPDSSVLMKWGASLRPFILNGQWWRLITCTFIHVGILHLLLNLYALLYIGVLLEPILGRSRFLAAYLLTGLLASVNSLVWHEMTISAGASGAIFGLYGVFLALLATDIVEPSARRALRNSILVFIAINLIYGLKGDIDNAAHIGGLISGVLIGYAFVPGLKRAGKSFFKYPLIGLLTLLIIGASFFACKQVSNDSNIYQSKMELFDTQQQIATEVFRLPADAPKETILHRLKDKSIPCWQRNLQLTREIEKLDISKELLARNKKIQRYCELSIRACELTYKQQEANTDEYNPEIKRCYTEMEQLTSKMNEPATNQ